MEDDHVRPSGRLPAEPQRRLDRLAAGVREEHPVQTLGEHLAEPVHERQQRAVHDGRVLRVDERADLPLGRLDDARVAVPGTRDADARGEVEVPAVVLVVQQHAFASGGDHAGRLLQDLRELGHGLPLVQLAGRLSTISVSQAGRLSTSAVTALEVPMTERPVFASRPRAKWSTLSRSGCSSDGKWVDAAGGGTFEVFDPSTGMKLCAVADATPADGMAALDAAVAAQPSWAATAPRQRADILMARVRLAAPAGRRSCVADDAGDGQAAGRGARRDRVRRGVLPALRRRGGADRRRLPDRAGRRTRAS